MDYEVLAAQLGGKNSDFLPEPNTSLVQIGDGTVGIKYYDTIVVRYHADGTVEVNTDGQRKKTTKNRINRYLPNGYRVKQLSGNWYLCMPDGMKKKFSDRARFSITESRNKKMKNTTIHDAVLQAAKEQYARFCPELITEGQNIFEQDEDPAMQPPGSPPPPPGEGQDLDVDATAPPAGTEGAESGNAAQELADEIYELMKQEGDVSEGFLKQLFKEKGYEESDVESALKILENDGRAGKRSTFYVSVEETDGEDDMTDEAGVTPGAVEGDMEDMGGNEELPPPPGGAEAGQGSPMPGPGGAEGPPPLGMKNKRARNSMYMDNEGEEDMDDLEMSGEMDDELAGDDIGMDDMDDTGSIEMGSGEDDEELSSMVDEVGDDIKDLKDLINAIEPRLDDIRARLKGSSIGDMSDAKNMKKNAYNYYDYPPYGDKRKRAKGNGKNAYFSGGGANYPIYGQPNTRSGAKR